MTSPLVASAQAESARTTAQLGFAASATRARFIIQGESMFSGRWDRVGVDWRLLRHVCWLDRRVLHRVSATPPAMGAAEVRDGPRLQLPSGPSRLRAEQVLQPDQTRYWE